MTNSGNSLRRRDKDFLANMSTSEKRAWAKGIVSRMMQAWGVNEIQDLSQFIGGHIRMPSNWINKGVIPWEVIYTCHLETGASLDWLYNGKLAATEVSTERHSQLVSQILSLLNAAERVGYVSKDKPNGFAELAQLATKEVLDFFNFSPKKPD